MTAPAPIHGERLRADALDGHRAMLRRYVAVLGTPMGTIDDLLQEVFVVALGKPFDDRGPEATGALLRSIARNLVLRARRTTAGRREVELAHEVWCEDEGDHDGDRRVEALRACVEALPERGRQLLQLRYVDGLDRGALARAVGMRPFGVKTALRRLRAALRACLERRRNQP